MHLSTAVWFGVGATVVVLAVIILFVRGSSAADLGSVSDQWVAQHRASDPD
jgi:hypothetical protein